MDAIDVEMIKISNESFQENCKIINFILYEQKQTQIALFFIRSNIEKFIYLDFDFSALNYFVFRDEIKCAKCDKVGYIVDMKFFDGFCESCQILKINKKEHFQVFKNRKDRRLFIRENLKKFRETKLEEYESVRLAYYKEIIYQIAIVNTMKFTYNSSPNIDRNTHKCIINHLLKLAGESKTRISNLKFSLLDSSLNNFPLEILKLINDFS
jgi:hypothetical protein